MKTISLKLDTDTWDLVLDELGNSKRRLSTVWQILKFMRG